MVVVLFLLFELSSGHILSFSNRNSLVVSEVKAFLLLVEVRGGLGVLGLSFSGLFVGRRRVLVEFRFANFFHRLSFFFFGLFIIFLVFAGLGWGLRGY